MRSSCSPHGVNLMREHIKPTSRLHYTIVDGGDVPNVVPEYAKVWLWARDWERAEVERLLARIRKLAEGAAIMTETTSTVTVQAGSWEVLPNLAGARLLDANLRWLGPVSYSDEEQAFARAIQRATGVPEAGMDAGIQPLENQEQEGGSTDVGDVSWVVPTLTLTVATSPEEAPWHAWPVVATGGMSIGHKGLDARSEDARGDDGRSLRAPRCARRRARRIRGEEGRRGLQGLPSRRAASRPEGHSARCRQARRVARS